MHPLDCAHPPLADSYGSRRFPISMMVGGPSLGERARLLVPDWRREGIGEVMPGEAGVTKSTGASVSDRGPQALQGEIAQGIRGDVLGDFLDRVAGGNQLLPRGRVDAVEARPTRRGTGDPKVDFGCAGVLDHLDDLPRRGAPDDRVIYHHHPL